jgi:hypothetical protein
MASTVVTVRCVEITHVGILHMVSRKYEFERQASINDQLQRVSISLSLSHAMRTIISTLQLQANNIQEH